MQCKLCFIAYHTNIIKSTNIIININKCKAIGATAVILLSNNQSSRILPLIIINIVFCFLFKN